jgi:FKBP-type peptidyl-prolyl cis-trans isomerase 2
MEKMKQKWEEKHINNSEAVRTHMVLAVFILLLIGLLASGCASTGSIQQSSQTLPVSITAQPGDGVDIHFLCRFKNGELVADSKTVAGGGSKPEDLLQLSETGAISIVAVSPDEPLSQRLHRPAPFDQELLERLSRNVTGMKQGENRQVELTAEMIPAENETAGFAWLSKVRTRAKVQTMTICEYRNITGKDPEKGGSIFIEPSFPGVVEWVNGDEVVIRFSATPGEVIETPFGPGLIREEGEYYKVDIDAREGSIVRTGAKIGRITRVDERVITVDYRHPFGYEELLCDVTVEKIRKADTAKIEGGV